MSKNANDSLGYEIPVSDFFIDFQPEKTEINIAGCDYGRVERRVHRVLGVRALALVYFKHRFPALNAYQWLLLCLSNKLRSVNKEILEYLKDDFDSSDTSTLLTETGQYVNSHLEEKQQQQQQQQQLIVITDEAHLMSNAEASENN